MRITRFANGTVVALLLAGVLVVSGCATSAPTATPAPAAPHLPAPPLLTTPLAAVRSYLDWTSLAYRVSNSDVASLTTTPEELVRVDSYVQLNRERSRAIEQRMVAFASRPPVERGAAVLIGATERWSYRYISPDGSKYVSAPLQASYDTTYTLVRQPGKATWVVGSVQVTPLGAVR